MFFDCQLKEMFYLNKYYQQNFLKNSAKNDLQIQVQNLQNLRKQQAFKKSDEIWQLEKTTDSLLDENTITFKNIGNKNTAYENKREDDYETDTQDHMGRNIKKRKRY